MKRRHVIFSYGDERNASKKSKVGRNRKSEVVVPSPIF